MPNIVVWGGPFGSSLRVHWMLAELGLPYETKSLDLKNGEHKMPEYLEINPAGQIPAIQIDEFKLAESTVISRYLAKRFKAELNGTTLEEEAKAMQWELWTLLNVQHEFHVLAMPVWTGVHVPEAEEKSRETLSKILPLLDMQLSKSAYLGGENFTTSDLNTAVCMTYASFSQYDLSSYANISRWMSACTSRAAYVAATAQAKA